MRWLFICFVPLISCSSFDLDRLKETAWETGQCSIFSALGCAGQSVGACSVSSRDENFKAFGKCLVSTTPDCIAKSLSRCTFSGIVKSTGSMFVASGGKSCTTEADVLQVQECVTEKDPQTENETVHAVSTCWVSQCSY